MSRRTATQIKHAIGYMSQLFSLYHDLTVDENIEFAAGLREVTGERLARRREWVLRMSGLTEHVNRSTGDLPLGWKQRLALGCAVLHEPPVLFLDEPTSGVDPLARRAFWEVIRELSVAGTTVFVSTHYMEEAEYCDRLALMNRGKLIALGTPAELRASMPEAVLRVETENAPRAVATLTGVDGIIDASLFGRALRVVVTEATHATAVIRERIESAGLAMPFDRDRAGLTGGRVRVPRQARGRSHGLMTSITQDFPIVARPAIRTAERIKHVPKAFSITRLWAIARKEAIQLRRDARSLGLAFVLPLVMLVLFGYAITTDVQNITTAIVDRDHTPESRALTSAFSGSNYFLVKDMPATSEGVEELIDLAKVRVVIVIPERFSVDLKSGRPAAGRAAAGRQRCEDRERRARICGRDCANVLRERQGRREGSTGAGDGRRAGVVQRDARQSRDDRPRTHRRHHVDHLGHADVAHRGA